MSALDARPAIVTIPLHADFAAVLSERLLAIAGPDPLALARALVLLPNRRATAALTRAFLRRRDGLLLPRMIAVADLDDSDAPLSDDLAVDCAPAVSAAERRFHLAGWLRASDPELRPAAALRDATALGAALDALTFERRTPADLAGIDVGALSAFWSQTVTALRHISQAWPARLAAEGRTDEAARRVTLLDLTARRWTESGADGRLVVAAGIAAAPPPVAALLKVVARLPKGIVVLPGVDLGMGEEAWAAVDPGTAAGASHPQAAMKQLLDALDAARGEVEVWDEAAAPARARVGAAARALDPAAFTGGRPMDQRAALDMIRLVEAANPAEEALVIAAALRRALLVPGRTASLVTPDRALAGRVVSALARWDIAADDSAGVPLSQLPPGVFLRLLATATAERFAPAPLLALLEHPLASVGEDRSAHLAHVRALDETRRGAPPPPGLARAGADADPDWWNVVAAALGPLDGGPRPLPAWIEAMIAACEVLAADQVWRGEAGRTAAATLEAVRDSAAPFGQVAPAALPGVLAALLGEVAVRPAHGLHPRISILGLLEARLQRSDLVVLGGLSEGAWPAPPAADPWLPPAARRALGLPPLERRIGLAAHDLLGQLGADEVILTRARRDASAPTSPSRFLLRLLAAAGGTLPGDAELLRVARGLDAPAAPPRLATRPAPAPPAAARPKTISVTAVDTLRADPFSYYAAHILKLREWEPVAADLSPADRGDALHRALERWANTGAPPTELVRQGMAYLQGRFGEQPRLKALWMPRLRNALQWAADRFEETASDGWSFAAAEARGESNVGGVLLKGRADRIERRGEALAIIDFKTGAPPSPKQIGEGYALQLALLAVLAGRGALEGVPLAEAARLEYWKLSGGRSKPGECRSVLSEEQPHETGAEAAAYAAAQLATVAAKYLNGSEAFIAKLKPEYANRNRSFDQLGRLEEWVDRVAP